MKKYTAILATLLVGAVSCNILTTKPEATLDKETFFKQEDNPDAYFPRPRAYSSTGGQLRLINDRYLQNIRYLRLKNLTLGYTIPKKVTKVLSLDKVRVYFSGENLHYWSPLTKVTKYLDPEASFRRNNDNSSARNQMYYPWQKTFMFGIDITF